MVNLSFFSVQLLEMLIKRDFPRSSLPSLPLTKSSLPGDDSITVFLSVCVCVYVCVCEYLHACETRRHYQAHSQRKSVPDCEHAAFSFLGLTDGGQTESISYVYFQDSAVTDGKRGMRQHEKAEAGNEKAR